MIIELFYFAEYVLLNSWDKAPIQFCAHSFPYFVLFNDFFAVFKHWNIV